MFRQTAYQCRKIADPSLCITHYTFSLNCGKEIVTHRAQKEVLYPTSFCTMIENMSGVPHLLHKFRILIMDQGPCTYPVMAEFPDVRTGDFIPVEEVTSRFIPLSVIHRAEGSSYLQPISVQY